jgi:hypothetical protein
MKMIESVGIKRSHFWSFDILKPEPFMVHGEDKGSSLI